MGYKTVNREVFNRNTEESRNRSTGGDFWKPAVGKTGSPAKNVIRILPPHENMPDVFVRSKIHFSLGPNEDVGIPCLSQWGETCPACDHVDKLYKDAKREADPTSAAALKKKASDQKANLRFYASIVDMLKPEQGVQTYSFGPDVEADLRACFYDDDQEFRDISDPKSGRDVIVLVDYDPGKMFNDKPVRRYSIRAKESTSPLADMDWLDQIQDLASLSVKPTIEAVLNALKGVKRQKSTPAVQAPPVTTPQANQIDVRKEKSLRAKTASVRQPVSTDSFASARMAIASAGFASPITVSLEEVEALPKPPCYAPVLTLQGEETITDPTDAMCQSCRLLLPCMDAKLKTGK